MKKILSLALALMMLLALGACGSKGGETSDDPNLGKYIGAEFSGDGSQWFLLDEIYDEGESYIELKPHARDRRAMRTSSCRSAPC